jgi:ribosome-associated heat shock protein Hsp15
VTGTDGAAPGLRLDKYLWFARLTRSRGLAQAIAAAGHVRISGRVTDRAHAVVRVGDVLTLPLHGRVRVLRVTALPARRGPAAAARLCYDDLSPPVDAPGKPT